MLKLMAKQASVWRIVTGALIKILGFAGSLRKESYNRSVLRAAVKLVPQGAQLDTFSGVLKNAIDWASRPYGDSAWDGKTVGVVGASVGALGTARAQYHLRQMFVFLNMFPLNQAEVMIAHAEDKFDSEGNLKDQKTTQKIRELLETLIEWTKSLQKAKPLR